MSEISQIYLGHADYSVAPVTEHLPLDIRVLGHIELEIGGAKITPRSVRARSLLAVLALNVNALVSFERIADFVWEDPPVSMRQQIHNVVSLLRRILSPAGELAIVVTENAGYRLEAPSWSVDLCRFQLDLRAADSAEAESDAVSAKHLLQRAVASWRGPALADLVGRVPESVAAPLNEKHLNAVERLAELRLGLGEPVAVASILGELVVKHPYRERLRALLMLALAQSGRLAEAFATFEQGRRLLARELGVDPGPILLEAHAQVLRLSSGGPIPIESPVAPLSALTSVSGASDSAEKHTDNDRQQAPEELSFLPRDIGEFTGRLREIDYLTAQARKEVSIAPTVVVVYGMGGVGKTTLAVHAAHCLAEQYPDGRFFVDLEGFSSNQEPVKPLQALGLLLREAGTPPELLPSDLDSCIALWRSRLSGKRALVLLDNAADVGQLRPLLPAAPGSLVLISSRRRMTEFEGVVSLSLDVMQFDEAAMLFRSIVGVDRVSAEPEFSREVVALCSGLPLAIQIVAARLRTRPVWTIEFIVAQLRSYRGRARVLAIGERSVVDVLAWSYRHLTGAQQQLFRLLGLYPGVQIDTYAASALADMSYEEAESCLDELLEVNLIEQHQSELFQLHDLVRDCALALLMEHTADEERRRAVISLAGYYVQSIRQWCDAVTRGFFAIGPDVVIDSHRIKTAKSDEDAYELYEQEYRNIVAVQRLAVEYGLSDHAWQLTCYLIPYFALTNYSGESHALLESALACAREKARRSGESICLTGLASLSRRRGQPDEAVVLLRAALELSRGEGDEDAQIRQLTLLGLVHAEESRFDEARDCYSEAEALAGEFGDVQAQATLLNNLGNINLELGCFDTALQQFQQSMVLDDGFGMHDLRMIALVNMGYCLLLTGHRGQAELHFQESLALSQRAKSSVNEVSALIGLCSSMRQSGAHAEALTVGREALGIARKIEKRDLEILALLALGDTHLSMGKLQESERIFEQALKLAESAGSERCAAQAYEGLAHVRSALHDTDAASEYWRRALQPGRGLVYHFVEAQAHYSAPEYGATSCWRCTTKPGS